MTATTKSKQNNQLSLVDWENQSSPFYSDAHKKFRQDCRNFVTSEILPNIDKWERKGEIPKELYKKCYKAGLYSFLYEAKYGGTPVIDKDGNDLTHDLFVMAIWYDEFAKAGSGGLITSIAIHGIAVPPVLTFGSKQQKELMKPVVRGEKYAALAISEPTAGSDVRNLKTTAVRDPDDNDYYIVNGEKYWISGGIKADYFVTAVRTGKPGIGGISMMIIPRGKGVITSRLKLMGHGVSDTAYVVFRNVRVHKNMIIGGVNQGFMVIMYNFNHERMGIIMTAISLARVCVEEAVLYAKTRKTFGKPLIKHQVIRHKIADMSRQLLATHSFLETVCYQMRKDIMGRTDISIPRNVSLLKVQATKTLEFCAREACQIFGGRSYVRGGRAGKVERIYRDVRAFAIYGGSEEIMLDLAVKQAKL